AHSPEACTCDWEEQLDLTFHQLIYPEHVAAIIVEPVLGEGGYIVPPPGFLPRLREITRRHGILLIADEVQTGFGRTGEMFAVQFVKPREGDGRVPDPDVTKRVQAEALARKLIVLTAGTYVNVVRIIPPLVTTPTEVEQALRILDESLAAAGA